MPLIIIFSLLIWLQDFKSPFYVADRVGKYGKLFKMIKFRSMIVNASSSGVDSTAEDDNRITNIGKIVRKFKIDEIPQLFNVFMGKMSFVGPRPNVLNETNLYSEIENKILTVRPGITDFSSIVFSDEGEILKGSNGVRTFTFQNIGDVPIEIQGVKSSCGCTVPKKPNAPIPPGGKGEIQVKYDTNRIGVFRKTITVNTNAPSSPIIALKIKGNVLAK